MIGHARAITYDQFHLLIDILTVNHESSDCEGDRGPAGRITVRTVSLGIGEIGRMNGRTEPQLGPPSRSFLMYEFIGFPPPQRRGIKRFWAGVQVYQLDLTSGEVNLGISIPRLISRSL